MHSKTPHALLPLGALLLAATSGAIAQTAGADTTTQRTLATVEVKEKAEEAQGKDSLKATKTTIGRGTQELRDIPQSVTVVTERLIDDRNLDTVKEALKNTAGVSFLAAEGGEEDIRLRGFAVQATGDMFINGLRDPAIYDRDTFALDRLEVLRGSASMLFGRGSTGGAVNQVTKVPGIMDESQVDVTVGSHKYKRVTGDFNIVTGQNAALRLNVMNTTADNNGSGSAIDKNGAAVSYRWGIGERDEFTADLYYLNNNNGINYGMPWIRPTASSPASATTVLPLDPTAYYGLASDYNHSGATVASLVHLHRFDDGAQLKTQARVSEFTRDMRASTIRLSGNTGGNNPSNLSNFGPGTVLTRGTNNKIQDMRVTQVQSDYTGKFTAFGLKHELIAGADLAIERKNVYSASNPIGDKPTTTIGTPNDGKWVDEGRRVVTLASNYKSTGAGVYAQDTVEVAPHWKLVGGLRYDYLQGDYYSDKPYQMKVSEFSKRAGVLFQPNELQSYYMSLGTSFNTSGDAYSLNSDNVNTPPEQSINFEIGGKFESANKQWSSRVAVFRSTKLNERNTDPLVNATILSAKRHVAGLEVDLSGRITPKWEVYGSYMWLPIANIDTPAYERGRTGIALGETGRPSLTPRYSGTLWTTYQLTPQWRVGGGINFRGPQTPNRNPGWIVPHFVTGDLMAEYTPVRDKVTIKANITNVTNKLYADQLYSGHYVPGAGRMVQVTTSLKF